MSHEIDYHDRAIGDLYVAKLLTSPKGNPSNDEGVLDIAAYHVQQGIEKELKHIMHDICGVPDDTRVFRTHVIDDLIDQVETQTSFVVPDDVKEIALNLTNWEAQSRYPNSIASTLDEITTAIEIFEDLLDKTYDWIAEEYPDNIDNESSTDETETDATEDSDWEDPIE